MAAVAGSAPLPAPTPIALGAHRRATLTASPDARWVALLVADERLSSLERRSILPRYVTQSGFVETREIPNRVKAGAREDDTRLAVYDVASGALTWPDVPGLGDREVNHYGAAWSPEGTRLLFIAGALDLKDRWLVVYDPRERKATVVDHDHDDAWLRDVRGDVSTTGVGWIDEDRVYFSSERDGWNHLYATTLSTGALTQLTRGAWEVSTYRLSRDRRTFYFTGTEAHPCERPVYRVGAAGGVPERLTTTPGWYAPILSPDEHQLAVLYSDGSAPADLYVMENRPGAPMRRLTDGVTPAFRALGLAPPEIVTFRDKWGHAVHAQIARPRTPRRGLPAIVYAHGTGYEQGVRRAWSDETLVFTYLARQGYVVLGIDYAGSAGYGRASRVALYRGPGERDIDSAVAAVDYLAREHGVDRRRVGIYGGSYGGFYTLMALFTRPGVFRAGVSLYPLTDFAHYTPRFVGRFLDQPWDNPEGYRRSSPIHRAEGLRDHLLLMHGLEDGNVFAQDTFRLVQRLIELRKDTWEYHIYPTEGHGWRQESTRLDYLKRLTAFFDRHLKGVRHAS